MSQYFSTRVKIFYQDQIFSLGKTPNTISELFSQVIKSIPGTLSQAYLSLSYYDIDGDKIIITTTESLTEAYSMSPNSLKIFLDYKPPSLETNTETSEEIINIRQA